MINKHTNTILQVCGMAILVFLTVLSVVAIGGLIVEGLNVILANLHKC